MSRSNNLTSLHVIQNRQVTHIHDINDSLSLIETMLPSPKVSTFPNTREEQRRRGFFS